MAGCRRQTSLTERRDNCTLDFRYGSVDDAGAGSDILEVVCRSTKSGLPVNMRRRGIEEDGIAPGSL